MVSLANNHAELNIEEQLWQALEFDKFSDEMIEKSFLVTDQFIGTGHTDNACYMCSSNSATTHGCNTCC